MSWRQPCPAVDRSQTLYPDSASDDLLIRSDPRICSGRFPDLESNSGADPSISAASLEIKVWNIYWVRNRHRGPGALVSRSSNVASGASSPSAKAT